MKFNHIGIPTTTRFEGEIDLPHLKVTVSDHRAGVIVAFIKVAGAPVELLQIDRTIRSDL